MIANTIRINESNVLILYRDYGISFGASISKLIQAILDNPELAKNLSIRCKKEYISKTYTNNPSLYVRQFKSDLIISAYKDEEWVYIHRGHEKISNTFLGRAIREIRLQKTFHALKGSIPLSYLDRPQRFAIQLEKHFGCIFATIANSESDKIIWSCKKVDVDKSIFRR